MSTRGGRKIREPNSMEVTLPDDTTVDQGEFVEFDGWFGLVNFKNTADARGKIVLNIEMARYATSQLADGAQFSTGDLIYWDAAAGTLGASGGVPVGMVTEDGPDDAGVVEFIGGGLFRLVAAIAAAAGGGA
jgi:Uncharacterized conserved protein (DUF2190)